MVLDKKLIGVFEITLILISSFAFAYIVSETNELTESFGTQDKESKFTSFVRDKALNYLSRGIVSAQTSLQTCPFDNNGSYCQEYPIQICNSRCSTDCLPGRRSEFAACQLGTCYDSNLGLCNGGTPRSTCESQNGTWSAEQPVQCTRACCLIAPDGSGGASQARLATSQECAYLGQTSGAPVQWDPQTTGELQCLNKVRTQREGACVLSPSPNEVLNNCQFTTEVRCLTNGGTFYVDQLCTNPQLNTKCERTRNTQCFERKDGVYFVDSCGNRANIYDSSPNKIDNIGYWSSVVLLEQSCSLSSSLQNQQSCGNCNYLAGSTCGTPQPLDKQPNSGQYVCRDLRCKEPDGTIRDHGESWCVFESWTGLDGADGSNAQRATDAVGSRHYRNLCYEGEVRVEPLAEYRNGLCVEGEVRQGVTNAQPRTNTGQLCTSYNENADKLAKCEESPDCFLKHIEIDKWKFDVCVPKYAPGLELSDTPQPDSEAICSAASQTCTYYEKKNIEGRWTCKINCGCKDAEFAETMNNLCMSLGDCGSKFNLAGELGDGYSTSGDKSPKISDSYKDGLKKYVTPPFPHQKVDGFTTQQLEALFGIDFNGQDADEIASQIGLGVAGILAYGMYAGYSSAIGFGNGLAFQGWGGAANGALVGAGVGYILGLAFGAEGDELTTYVVAGAVVGAVLGYYWASVATYLGFGAAAGPVGWIIAIIVVITIIILSVAGVGKYREKHVTFSCLPWQPPSGGDNCAKCNQLGVECTAYKCKSLGATCELLNPETEEEACVDIAPNDVGAPVISLNRTYLSSNFSYEESATGVQIKTSAGDGCLQEVAPVAFDIVTNEPAQCKISTTRSSSFGEMEDTYFDSSTNRFVTNHVESTAMPLLDDLGVSGIDPNRRGDYNLYVMCKDRKGNPSGAAYNVRFCVSPQNDLTPPRVAKFVPDSPGVTGLNSTLFNLGFFSNEPATCKFSSTDQSYESMEGEATCDNAISHSTLDGWRCNAQLPISSDINPFFFRCADQPWLGNNVGTSGTTLEEGRNAATQSDTYTVEKTTTPLSISSATPNNSTIFSATASVSVTMDLVTTGGIDNGKAFCKYSLNNGDTYIDFRYTSLSTHRQTFTTLPAGEHNILLKCIDRASNVAEGSIQFRIEVDNVGPLITRIFSSGSTLNVITNEAATCAYATSSCSFDFANATLLSGLANSHTMPYNNGRTYRIKCQDTFANMGNCLSVSGGY